MNRHDDPGDKWQNKDAEAWQDPLPGFQFQQPLILVSGSSPIFTSEEFRMSLIYIDNISSSALCSLLALGLWTSSYFTFSFEIFFSLPILYYDSIQKDWKKDVKWPRQVLFTASGVLTTIAQWLSMGTCHSAPKTRPFVHRRTRQSTPTIPVLRHYPSFPPPCLEGTPQK